MLSYQYGSPPICSVVYLRNFVITKYGSPTNPFGSMFEEFCHYKYMVVLPNSVVNLRNFVIIKYGSPTNPFGSIFEDSFVITIYGSPTNPFSSIIEEFRHYKIW